jgi:FlaA1/EpsC-like NDP-sugar epimerase
MYEELLISGDQLPTDSPKIFKSMEHFPSMQLMQPIIEDINFAIKNDDHDQLLTILQKNVEDYNHE